MDMRGSEDPGRARGQTAALRRLIRALSTALLGIPPALLRAVESVPDPTVYTFTVHVPATMLLCAAGAALVTCWVWCRIARRLLVWLLLPLVWTFWAGAIGTALYLYANWPA